MRGILLLLLTILFENIDTTAMHVQAFDRISKNGEPILMLDLNNGPIDTLDRLQFIRLSFDYIPIRSFQEQVNLLKPEEAQPAVIDEIQFRFSNDEFQPQDQRYDIRFRPTNPLVRKKTKELYQNRKLQLQTDAARAIDKEIFERYELIISWIETQQTLKLIEERIAINRQRIEWLKEYPGADFFDANSYTDAHADKLKLWSDKTDLELKVKELHRSINLKLGDNISHNYIITWEQNITLSAQDIEAYLKSSVEHSLSQPLQVYLAQLAFQETQLEQEIERVNTDMGFIQTEYFPNRSNKSLLGISAGITLPLFHKNRTDLMNLSLEEKERSLDILAEQKKASLEQNYWKSHLITVLEKYLELVQLYIQMNLQEMRSTLQVLDDYEPLKTLEWQEMELNWKEIEQHWYFELIKTYIGYLSSKELLSREPYIDWLDAKSY